MKIQVCVEKKWSLNYSLGGKSGHLVKSIAIMEGKWPCKEGDKFLFFKTEPGVNDHLAIHDAGVL